MVDPKTYGRPCISSRMSNERIRRLDRHILCETRRTLWRSARRASSWIGSLMLSTFDDATPIIDYNLGPQAQSGSVTWQVYLWYTQEDASIWMERQVSSRLKLKSVTSKVYSAASAFFFFTCSANCLNLEWWGEVRGKLINIDKPVQSIILTKLSVSF